MMVFTIFTLFGIALFLNGHWAWGGFCFLVSFVALLSML